MKGLKQQIVGLTVVAFALWGARGAEDGLTHGKLTREDQALATMTAKVAEVDLEKRELTLKTSQGDPVTLVVDKSVKRLDEIKPGDEITARYYLSMAAELRDPTPAEKEKPITIVEGAVTAPGSSAPAAEGLRVIKVVASIEGLQRASKTVTLKCPSGKYLTVKAKDVDKLEKLHLGDIIVVTFTEGLAVEVNKTSSTSNQKG